MDSDLGDRIYSGLARSLGAGLVLFFLGLYGAMMYSYLWDICRVYFLETSNYLLLLVFFSPIDFFLSNEETLTLINFRHYFCYLLLLATVPFSTI